MQKDLKPYRVSITLNLGESKGIEASGILLALSESDVHETLNHELQRTQATTALPITEPVGCASPAPRETAAQTALLWDTLVVKNRRGGSVNVSAKLKNGAPTERFAELLNATEVP